MSTSITSPDAVHIKAKLDTGQWKSFAIDPSITQYDKLAEIIRACFNIKSDFSVRYLTVDDYGEQYYLPLQSDDDLASSISSCTNSILRIKITPKSHSVGDHSDWETKVVAHPAKQLTQSHSADLKLSKSKDQHTSSKLSVLGKLFANLISPIGNSVNVKYYPPLPPMSDIEFRSFMDSSGRVTDLNGFHQSVYIRGMDESIRRVGWRILLAVYPPDTSGQERSDLLKSKSHQYDIMKERWKQAYRQGHLTNEQLTTLASVAVDVVRTDWTVDYYRGLSNQRRVGQLFDLLATYSLNHPKVGYSQGMSDLASPLLIVQADEAHAYICFCALMQRCKSNFDDSRQTFMDSNMKQLYDLITVTDSKLAEFLSCHDLANLYFTQRWLMLELKREFSFSDCLRVFEVQWAAAHLAKLKSAPDMSIDSDLQSEGSISLSDCAPRSFDCSDSLNNSNDAHPDYNARDLDLINSLIGPKYTRLFPKSKPTATTTTPSNRHHHQHRPQNLDLDLARDENFSMNISNQFPSLNGHDSNLATDSPTSNDSTLSVWTDLADKDSGISVDKSYLSKLSLDDLPDPTKFGQGNPFLLFLCLSLLICNRDYLFKHVREPAHMIQFYQHKAGQHDTAYVLARAREWFDDYLKRKSTQRSG